MKRFSPVRFKFGLMFLLFTVYCSLFTVSVSYAGEAPKRIISLAPNITEILFALDLGENIVGVTNFCDYPEEARHKQKVGGMSNPSLEAVVSLKPDIVIMTTDGNPKYFQERLKSLKIRTYVFNTKRLQELPQGIRELGVALNIREQADRFAGDFEISLDKFRRQRSNSASSPFAKGGTEGSPKKKVLFIVWPEPLIVAGPKTVIDDAIAFIGAENVASKSLTSYPKYSIEEILRNPPDFIIIGKGHADVKKISEGFLKKIGIIPAVKEKKVFYVSDDLYRFGPRTIRGLAELSKVLGQK